MSPKITRERVRVYMRDIEVASISLGRANVSRVIAIALDNIELLPTINQKIIVQTDNVRIAKRKLLELLGV